MGAYLLDWAKLLLRWLHVNTDMTELHGFNSESHATWPSGFALFTVLYL